MPPKKVAVIFVKHFLALTLPLAMSKVKVIMADRQRIEDGDISFLNHKPKAYCYHK